MAQIGPQRDKLQLHPPLIRQRFHIIHTQARRLGVKRQLQNIP